jgi:hypothetical protein
MKLASPTVDAPPNGPDGLWIPLGNSVDSRGWVMSGILARVEPRPFLSVARVVSVGSQVQGRMISSWSCHWCVCPVVVRMRSWDPGLIRVLSNLSTSTMRPTRAIRTAMNTTWWANGSVRPVVASVERRVCMSGGGGGCAAGAVVVEEAPFAVPAAAALGSPVGPDAGGSTCSTSRRAAGGAAFGSAVNLPAVVVAVGGTAARRSWDDQSAAEWWTPAFDRAW